MQEPELFTTQETAKMLRRSKSTLDKWRMKSGGPVFMKYGNKVLYTKDSLLEFVAAHMCEHSGQAHS